MNRDEENIATENPSSNSNSSLQTFSNITTALPERHKRIILELCLNFLHPLDQNIDLSKLLLDYIIVNHLKIVVEYDHSLFRTDYIIPFKVPHGSLTQYLHLFNDCQIVDVYLSPMSKYLDGPLLELFLDRCDSACVSQVHAFDEDQRLWLRPDKVTSICEINETAAISLQMVIPEFPRLKTVSLQHATFKIIPQLNYLSMFVDRISVVFRETLQNAVNLFFTNTNPKIRTYFEKIFCSVTEFSKQEDLFLSSASIKDVFFLSVNPNSPPLENAEGLFYRVERLKKVVFWNENVKSSELYTSRHDGLSQFQIVAQSN
ncbi:unnamed protein product [Ambrosiozyma monospora]|uniref:Unnamed protein product n=1 Tax=Ambrosiozyma monospora TaxID=43982 RepID=A0A9W6YV06_AMBMO|nr:unnamed protein product [Ambrosiozyma monospora]